MTVLPWLHTVFAQADIPSMDDPVAKLMHMGKETCKKLADLAAAAEQASMELELEPHLACVEKVGRGYLARVVCWGGGVARRGEGGGHQDGVGRRRRLTLLQQQSRLAWSWRHTWHVWRR